MRPAPRPLPRSFYARDAETVARELLNKRLVRVGRGKTLVGRIVETEAYLGPHDRACHTARGKTARNAVMFGPPGHAYVYFVYGMHHCLNVVTGYGDGQAVLIRAVEPLTDGLEKTNGPARVCKAFHVTRNDNGDDLRGSELFIADGPAPERIVRRARVGVDYAGAWAKRLLRFYVRGNPWVSRR